MKFGKKDNNKSKKRDGKGKKQLNNSNNSPKPLFGIYYKKYYCNRHTVNNY